jgi:low temperature requirement protein LtrA
MKDKKEVKTEEIKSNTKAYFYASIVACVLAAVAFGLSFSFMGIYALISSVILSLCALSFAITQKKKNNFAALKFAFIAAYVMLALSVLLFIGGLIYSAIV